MNKDDYQAVNARFLLRGPTDSRDALDAILSSLEAFPLFAPTHFGLDERKRTTYDREAAIEKGLASTRWKKVIYLSNKSIDRAGQLALYIVPSNPVDIGFDWKKSVLERSEECLRQYRELVSTLRPYFAEARPVPDPERRRAEVSSSLLDERKANINYMSLAALRRVGFCTLRPHTYIDPELGACFEPALDELEARPASFGGFWIGEEARPLAPGLGVELETALHNGRVLRSHGLQGRFDFLNERYYYAPNWTPPASWTQVEDPVIERKIAGPNE